MAPLATLLFAAAVQGPTGPPAPALAEHLNLCVHSPDGWVLAEREGVDPDPLLLPRIVRSERVVRHALERRGLGLRLVADGGTSAVDTLELRAVEHASDEQVLLLEGAVTVVSPPVLPARIGRSEDGGEDLLPLLARQDGSCVEGGSLFVAPPAAAGAADTLVLIGGEMEGGHRGWIVQYAYRGGGSGWREGYETELPSRTRHGAVIPVPGRTLRIDLGEGRLDQVFYARLDRPPTDRLLPLELRSVRVFGVARAGTYRRGGQGPPLPLYEPRTPDDAPHLDVTTARQRLEADDGLMLDLADGEALEAWFAGPAETAEERTVTVVARVVYPQPTPDEGVGDPDDDGRGDAPGRGGGERREPEPPGFLRDVSRAAGIDFVHFEGPDEQLDIRPTMGPGAAWGDVDGDGWVDLYLVQGGGREGSSVQGNRLYRNLGDGTFADVSEAAGCADEGAGMGALFFDADGDRDLDLYVANYGPDALYVNDGAGRFVRASPRAGVGGDLWSAGVCAGDADGDGDLDLYVSSYLRYDEAQMPAEEDLAPYRREDPVAMLPFAFSGERNTFLRNVSGAEPALARDDGSVRPREASAARPDGPPPVRFFDATEELGLADADGRGMQPVFWDFDRDSDQDLYVANDVSYNVLWRNEAGAFRDISFMTGMDDPRGGMGVAVGDVDEDGDEDLFLTNWQLEPNALYVNNLLSHRSVRHRVATFRDRTVDAGLGPSGVGVTSWGAELLDADGDGDLDLFVANGYTSPDYESTGICVGQPNHYFENDGSGRFRDAGTAAGPALDVRLASRGAVACDYDKDGDPDLVVTANNGRVQLLRNEVRNGNHWLAIRLRGGGRNPYAIGAEVTVITGDRRLRRTLRAGTGYLTGNPPELGFGLGAARTVDEVIVRWPSGLESRHAVEGIDRYVELVAPR